MNPDWHRAFIGLGGNLSGPLGESADYLRAALDRLGHREGLKLLACSSLYESEPWGNRDQPAFVNAVAEVYSRLDSGQLLGTLLEIEEDLGRRRDEKWGPRLIDLDLLCFDDLQLDSATLILPHPHMHERAFVLEPLLELDPLFTIPGKGSARALRERIGDGQSVRKI